MSEAADQAATLRHRTLTLQDLLHFHANEVDTCTDEERPFHDAAVLLLGETMQAVADAPPEGDGSIRVVLDEITAPNKVEERVRELRMPTVPLPGEGVRLNGRDYQVQARFTDVKGGKTEVHLLVSKVFKPGEVMPASEQQMNGLGPAPGQPLAPGSRLLKG
jgi:hypothetical protein